MKEALLTDISTWLGIVFCISQSAMFSGLNLAFFSVTRLRLEVEVASNSREATRVLTMRQDSNFLLTTILWGNVGVNVLLTLLSDSVLAGVGAFVFSTVIITFVGEILPQAYFSRHALRMASLLAPILRLYQIIFYPVAKPVALLLDWMLGKEGIQYFREEHLRDVIKKHMESSEADVDQLEGIGALNFLDIDDLLVSQEGELADPESIISLPARNGLPIIPKFERSAADTFLQQIQASGKKWVILIDEADKPLLVLDADGFLRATLFDGRPVSIFAFCHRPIVVENLTVPLDEVLSQLKVQSEHTGDDVIDQDLILVWGQQRRVITGADILGRLLRGIVKHDVVQRKRPAS